MGKEAFLGVQLGRFVEAEINGAMEDSETGSGDMASLELCGVGNITAILGARKADQDPPPRKVGEETTK